jgi:hypothetical protein
MGRPCAALVLVDRNLNAYADRNDIETITKKINGGKNGLVNRIEYYGRISLVLLGYQPIEADIRRYQSERGLDVDGDVGPKLAPLCTRIFSLSRMHRCRWRPSPPRRVNKGSISCSWIGKVGRRRDVLDAALFCNAVAYVGFDATGRIRPLNRGQTSVENTVEERL